MSHRPPELSRSSRAFVWLLDRMAALGPRRRGFVAVIALMLPPLLEMMTRPSVNFGLLYICGVALAVWSVGEMPGVILTALCALAGAAAAHLRIAEYHLPIGPVSELWNGFARLISLELIAIVVSGLHGALALERWRAGYDALTGVLNKRAFEAAAASSIARARANGRTLVLAYLDLDGFKGVNDRHGHSAGDRVLQSFAAAAAASIRSSDLFARIGGDEFVALLTVRSEHEGDQMAETLHARLSDVLARSGFAITCSMGALVAAGDQIDLQRGALELADMLMYEVKRSGKNALRVAHGAPAVVTAPLREAFPPDADRPFADLVERIDASTHRAKPQRDRRVISC